MASDGLVGLAMEFGRLWVGFVIRGFFVEWFCAGKCIGGLGDQFVGFGGFWLLLSDRVS